LLYAEPFRRFCHFCGTMILLAPSFLSHGKNGKNGNFYFAPYGAFLSFLSFPWDYYYHRMFFMSHGKNRKNGNFYFAPCGAFPLFPLYDYPHISAIDPEKGLRSVTVGRNDLRMMWMMAICTLNECPNCVCGRPRKGRYTHCHLSEGATHTSVTER